MLSIDLDIGDVVLEHGGDIDLARISVSLTGPAYLIQRLARYLGATMVERYQGSCKEGWWMLTSGKVPLEKTLVAEKESQYAAGIPTRRRMRKRGGKEETHINRQVLPQAPSPTMTSLRRISAIL